MSSSLAPRWQNRLVLERNSISVTPNLHRRHCFWAGVAEAINKLRWRGLEHVVQVAQVSVLCWIRTRAARVCYKNQSTDVLAVPLQACASCFSFSRCFLPLLVWDAQLQGIFTPWTVSTSVTLTTPWEKIRAARSSACKGWAAGTFQHHTSKRHKPGAMY